MATNSAVYTTLDEPALEICTGKHDDKSFLVKAPAFRLIERDTKTNRWTVGESKSFRSAAVKLANGRHQIMLVIEPDEVKRRRTLGPFYVRGWFRVVETIEDDREASARFAKFVPQRTSDDRAYRKRTMARLVSEIGIEGVSEWISNHWDGDRLAIIATQSQPGAKRLIHLDFGGFAGGVLTMGQARTLKAALRREGLDFSIR